ncbi:MAG: response regulator [Candidatus Ozemobacteraceae bacterium]
MGIGELAILLNILYLEDSPRDAELIRETLIDAGFEATFDLAATKEEYTSFLCGDRRYDIILSDFKLIGFNAFEALRLSTDLCPGVPFICISGTIGEETAVELLKKGAIDYVFKDRIAKLPMSINRAIQETKEKVARQKAEEALRRNEERLREAQALGRIGNWEYDIGRRKIVWSDETYVLFERDPNLGPPSPEEETQCYSSSQAAKLVDYASQVIETGEGLSFDIEPKLPSGRSVFFHVIMHAFKDAGGRVTGLFGTVQDITDRKRMEIDLLQSEKKYRNLVVNLNEGIWLVDRNEITTFVNPRMAEMLAYTMEEMIGEPLSRFMDDEGRLVARQDAEKRNSDARNQDTLEFIRKDGSKVFALVTTSPIFDESGSLSGLLSGIIDVSEQKKLEKEKDRIQEQLFQSQKMEAIGTLAGGIAHDLNNLLTPILGFAELAIEKTAMQSPVRGDLNEIRFVANRAADLVRQLLYYSRKQPMRLRNLNLNQTIERMSKMLKRLIREEIEIKMELQTDIWNIYADETRIEQVLLNTAVNARDAIPGGGILTIRTENVTLDEKRPIDVPDIFSGRFVRLSIRDNGIGMTSEVIQKAFEPFFTTKCPGKGTGLGLSVVYSIIKQHNGWIGIDSEANKGSTFKIYLPVSSENGASVTQDVAASRDISGHGETILVIDDNEEIRKYLFTALSLNGYTVFSAADEKECGAIYDREKENIDLILCDVRLSGTTGIELITRLLPDNSDLKVIFSSGCLDDMSHWEMINEKGFPFLQKPYSLDQLLSTLRKALE